MKAWKKQYLILAVFCGVLMLGISGPAEASASFPAKDRAVAVETSARTRFSDTSYDRNRHRSHNQNDYRNHNYRNRNYHQISHHDRNRSYYQSGRHYDRHQRHIRYYRHDDHRRDYRSTYNGGLITTPNHTAGHHSQEAAVVRVSRVSSSSGRTPRGWR